MFTIEKAKKPIDISNYGKIINMVTKGDSIVSRKCSVIGSHSVDVFENLENSC